MQSDQVSLVKDRRYRHLCRMILIHDRTEEQQAVLKRTHSGKGQATSDSTGIRRLPPVGRDQKALALRVAGQALRPWNTPRRDPKSTSPHSTDRSLPPPNWARSGWQDIFVGPRNGKDVLAGQVLLSWPLVAGGGTLETEQTISKVRCS